VKENLRITYPVNGVESEHLASNEGTLNLVHEVVIPLHNLGVTQVGLERGLRTIHVAVLDHHADDAERIGDDGALRRTHNVHLLA
jgi:hypothetical protein